MKQPRKLLMLFGLLAVMALMSSCFGGTEVAPAQDAASTAAADTAKAAEPAASAPAKPAPAPATRNSINKDLLEEDLSFDSLPLVRTMDLNEGMVYSAKFSTDQPIQFVVYSEKRYNEWKQSGAHTISKATTVSGTNCCSTEGGYTFDINSGEGGTYYFVFDDSKLGDKDPRPTSGSLTVTLASNI